jgi:hypothetical protein
MIIQVEDSVKTRIARNGANKLLGVDYDTRKQMRDEELIELFDRVWVHNLKKLVVEGVLCTPKEASRRLEQKYHAFIDYQQEHRSFIFSKAEFIAQLMPFTENEYQLTQIWRVSSSDNHPKTLFINFSTVEEKERFTELAESLGFKKDEDLGLSLIRNFMSLHTQPQKINDKSENGEAEDEDEDKLDLDGIPF